MIATWQRYVNWSAWQEVLVLNALAIIFPFLVFENDPLLLESLFFWPIMGSLFIALRYGFSFAGLSLLVLISFHFWAISSAQVVYTQAYSFEKMAAYSLIVLIAGEFRDTWERKIEKLSTSVSSSQKQLSSFATNYHLLRTSHHRMEKILAVHALSLRESLQSIRSVLNELTERDIHNCAQQIIDLFVEYGGIQSAGLYLVEKTKVQSQVLVKIGKIHPLETADPLLKECLRSSKITAVKQEVAGKKTQYQVAIPIADTSGNLYGVLLVEQIQFFSLNHQTMTLLAVMAGHIGDSIRTNYDSPVLSLSDAHNFIYCVDRAQSDSLNYELSSQLLGVRALGNEADSRALFKHISQSRRGLDIYYQQDKICFWVLMPLTAKRDVQAYLDRLDRWAIEILGKSLEQMQINITSRLSFPLSKQELAQLSFNPIDEHDA